MSTISFEIRRASAFRFWLGAILLIPTVCNAHDQPVHMAITQSAVRSSDGFASFLSDISQDPDVPLLFQPQEFPQTQTLPPISWVTNGAYHEDDTPRFADHFYTLVPNRVIGQVQGLTDWHESIFLPGHTDNSYNWGTVYGLAPPVLLGYSSPPQNTENWEWARGYQVTALTSTAKSDRDANMAHMFYSLGHILHLNQDLSQPDHVRNDEHFHSWHRWIENYGSEVYLHESDGFPLQPHGWAYWQSQGFSKIRDFWDRGFFVNGSSDGLNADALGTPGAKLGLAEFSNGNFIGEDAIYAEFFGHQNIHYFPFPSLANTTQPQINPAHIAQTVIDTVTLENHKQGDVVYISKIGAGNPNGSGIPIIHHSALSYFAVKHPDRMNMPGMQVELNIHDPNVLQEYHSILIPKAIEYSAGILDYFFRGDLVIDLYWDGITGQFEMSVMNDSGQDFSGGQFHLLYDDAITGTRATVPDADFSDYGNYLADGDFFDISFTPPINATPTNYILVYQGTIGVDDSKNALDPVDDGIAVAAMSSPAAMIVTGSPLPDGRENQPYSQQLEEVGFEDETLEPVINFCGIRTRA